MTGDYRTYRGCVKRVTGGAQGCTGRDKEHIGNDRGRQEIFLLIGVFRARSVRNKERISKYKYIALFK